jgi:plasmid stabilization system protein ParE
VAFEIVFSDYAEDTARLVYHFIKENFGKKAADSFRIKLKRTLHTISEFPYSFKSAELDESIRIGLITKHTSVVYEIRADAIYLKYFWDNRQEPMIL